MLGARISVTDWVDGGLPVEEGVEVARALHDAGVSYICCSSGGNSPRQKIPTGPGYQVHLAEAVKKAVGVPVRAVGMIDEARQAEAIIAGGRADTREATLIRLASDAVRVALNAGETVRQDLRR